MTTTQGRILRPEILLEIMPHAGKRAALFVPHLNANMPLFGIDTPLRQAAFLAQVAHESGSLAYVREIASGEAYEGRKDLGNTQPGDGRRFRGRGLLQITGRANYAECGKGIGLDLLSHPELLEDPVHAVRSACWFWLARGLNTMADTGDIVKVSKRINGGTNGLAPRVAYYKRALAALGAS